MKWPKVAVCIITYDRQVEIKRTIMALKEHLKYKGRLCWHLADDGSPDGYIPRIKGIFPDLHFSHTQTNRKGWGVNVNKALNFLTNNYNYIYMNEDDYVANRDIDLSRGIALMESIGSIGHIRYDGVEGHKLTLHLTECVTEIGKIFYAVIDKKSKGLNVYSNRPHLTRRTWREKLGEYPEGFSLGATEKKFAHRVRDVETPASVVLVGYVPRAFSHIGHSRQGTELDRGAGLKVSRKRRRKK